MHAAARIGALAGGGEIFASSETLEGVGVESGEPREVTLEGIADPVQIVMIDWRSAWLG